MSEPSHSLPPAPLRGRRSPFKLLATVVRRTCAGTRRRSFLARQAPEGEAEERVPHRRLGEGATAREQTGNPLLARGAREGPMPSPQQRPASAG
jgi:hypothetical protein